MDKALDLVRLLINGANEYEKETGNKNPTVYLSRNNLLIIQQALLKAQEPKKYVDELKLVEKKLKALEIIKEKVGFKFFNRTKEVKIYLVDGDGCVYLRNETGDTLLHEEEFNLLKEVLE